MAAKRDPWIKFYFADWRAEPRLKLCCRAARSLWFDLLGIMHEATPYGFLLVEGISPTPSQIANLTGDAERDVRKWLGELRAAGVASFTGDAVPDDVDRLMEQGLADGVMFSRRMVRDSARKARDRENGRCGGNPNIDMRSTKWVKGGVNPLPNPFVENGVNQKSARGLKPRSQKPETRKPPDPPLPPVNPPDASWAPWLARLEAKFGPKPCASWLVRCRVIAAEGGGFVIESWSKSTHSWISSRAADLSAVLEGCVDFRLVPHE